MTNYRALMQQARLENNTGKRAASIPAKQYSRHTRSQAKRYTTENTSTSSTAWVDAPDVDISYEELEAAFWS